MDEVTVQAKTEAVLGSFDSPSVAEDSGHSICSEVDKPVDANEGTILQLTKYRLSWALRLGSLLILHSKPRSRKQRVNSGFGSKHWPKDWN